MPIQTTKYDMRRREFLKIMGLAGVTLPTVKLVGRAGGYNLLASEEKYGGFTVREDSGSAAGHTIDLDVYTRFQERNTMFSRAHWDPETEAMLKKYQEVEARRIKNGDPGFTLLDYAFNQASWTGSDVRYYRWRSRGRPSGTAIYGLPPLATQDFPRQELTDMVKKAALFYGASMVGISSLDERWVYSRAYYRSHERENHSGPIEAEIFIEDRDEPVRLSDKDQVFIPSACRTVISMVLEMDLDASEAAPTCIAAAATGSGYSRMALTAGSLANFIRYLGHRALPLGNDTALSIPLAIDAGLGELGRNGLLVTPKYGSRVRLCKVITDLPLVPDKPIRFGVTEFCEVCKKCAEYCPSGSIMNGERTNRSRNFSTNPGVEKWPINAFSCYEYWMENGTDCNTCIYVCPYNKPQSWLHDAARGIIEAKSAPINKLILELDDACGYGGQVDPEKYWKKKNFMHIKP